MITLLEAVVKYFPWIWLGFTITTCVMLLQSIVNYCIWKLRLRHLEDRIRLTHMLDPINNRRSTSDTTKDMHE